MKKIYLVGSIVVFLAALTTFIPTAVSYERYNDGCQSCHGAFTDNISTKGSVFPSDNKHEMHRASSEMNTECTLCHTSGDAKNPFIGSSNGTGINPGIGCTGCHRAPGLRAHHATAGETECATCHANDPPPLAESVNPVYYGTADTFANDSCNLTASAQTNENWTIGDFEGTDNDGDGVYDGADSDCGGPTTTPAEVLDLLVAAHDPAQRTITISFNEATCSATENNLYYGLLGDVVTPAYTGQDCSVGNTGSYDWIYPTGTDSLFFVVVGSDTAVEGSYGKRSDSSERDPAETCTETYDLTNRCD